LTLAPDGGDLEPKPRSLVVELIPSGEKKTVQYDGQSTEVKF
jgi:hypothetical protein